MPKHASEDIMHKLNVRLSGGIAAMLFLVPGLAQEVSLPDLGSPAARERAAAAMAPAWRQLLDEIESGRAALLPSRNSPVGWVAIDVDLTRRLLRNDMDAGKVDRTDGNRTLDALQERTSGSAAVRRALDAFPVRGGTGPAAPITVAAAAPGSACGHTLGSGIYGKWLALGGQQGLLGCPVMSESPASNSPQGSTGRWANFQHGLITWMLTGTRPHQGFEVHGDIRTAYLGLGGSSSWLGFAVSDEYDAPGGRRNDFEGGYIFWDRNTRATRAERYGAVAAAPPPAAPPAPPPGAPGSACGHTLGGGIYGKWLALGGQQGLLGCPVMSESPASNSPQGSTGRWANFQHGLITWMLTGTRPHQGYEVHGDIRTAYLGLGGSSSWLGFAVSDEYDVPGGRRNDFEGGYIFWDRNTRATRAERYGAVAATPPPAPPLQTEGHIPAPPEGRNYASPQMNGASVDWCATWATNCGQGGADQFCRMQGHARASSFFTFTPGRTYVIGSRQICQGAHCTGFAQVTCEGRR